MKYLYLNKHWSVNKEYNIDKLLYLMIDRPDNINSYNDYSWRDDNHKFGRDYDLPAGYVIYLNNDDSRIGNLFWTKNK